MGVEVLVGDGGFDGGLQRERLRSGRRGAGLRTMLLSGAGVRRANVQWVRPMLRDVRQPAERCHVLVRAVRHVR